MSIIIDHSTIQNLHTFFNSEEASEFTEKWFSYVASSMSHYVVTGDFQCLNNVIKTSKAISKVRITLPLLKLVASHPKGKKGLYQGKQGKLKSLTDEQIIAAVEKAIQREKDSVVDKPPAGFDAGKAEKTFANQAKKMLVNGMTQDKLLEIIRTTALANPQPVAVVPANDDVVVADPLAVAS